MEPLSDRVARKTFTMGKRGYEIREVEPFMADLVDQIRGLENELANAYGKLNAYERVGAAGKDAELVVQDAFRIATTRRDEIIAQAEARAAAIIADAETRAGRGGGGIAQGESDFILAEAQRKADQAVAAAQHRAREILRVAKAEAENEKRRLLDDAGGDADEARAEYRAIAGRLVDLKQAVNRMLQDGAGASEEIRLVFARDGVNSEA